MTLVSACLLANTNSLATDVLLGSPTPNTVPADEIDHSIWNELLSTYVDGRGMVDYTSWKTSTKNVQLLDQYINHLSSATFASTTADDVKLAYWINAYNAVTIKGILREYPTSSIRNHTARFYGYNIWKNLKLHVDGGKYSLDDIEHKVLRKMGEPRIHFAIVCASIGCPRLLNEAYTSDRIDEQLAMNARDFFSDHDKLRYDVKKRTVSVSPILKWFGEDFGSDQSARLRTIAPYLPNQQVRNLAESGNVRISYLDYDWDLNDQAKAR